MQSPITVLSIDIGTSSLKAGLIDTTGSLLAFERERFSKEKPGTMWLDAFLICVKKIFQEQGHAPPTAISISGNGPTLAFLHKDSSGKESADILLWNEPVAEPSNINKITQVYQGKSLFIPRILSYFASLSSSTSHATARPTHSISIIQKLRSLQKIISGPEYLVWQLTGKAHTLLPNPRFAPAYWCDEELEHYGIAKHLLPDFIQIGENSGYLKETFLPYFSPKNNEGNTENIAVLCAGPDFTSALIGTNTLSPGLICDRAGSSEGFNLCTEWPLKAGTKLKHEDKTFDTEIRNLPSIISPFFNASTLIPDSGIRFSKTKRQSSFAKSSYTDYVEHLLENHDEAGYKIMIELAHECKLAFDILYDAYSEACKKQGIKKNSERKMVVTGGQAKNEAWLKLKANIMDVSIEIPLCVDAELIGNAAIAFWSLGIYPSLEKATESVSRIAKVMYPQ
jgi:xylulokinase